MASRASETRGDADRVCVAGSDSAVLCEITESLLDSVLCVHKRYMNAMAPSKQSSVHKRQSCISHSSTSRRYLRRSTRYCQLQTARDVWESETGEVYELKRIRNRAVG